MRKLLAAGFELKDAQRDSVAFCALEDLRPTAERIAGIARDRRHRRDRKDVCDPLPIFSALGQFGSAGVELGRSRGRGSFKNCGIARNRRNWTPPRAAVPHVHGQSYGKIGIGGMNDGDRKSRDFSIRWGVRLHGIGKRRRGRLRSTIPVMGRHFASKGLVI